MGEPKEYLFALEVRFTVRAPNVKAAWPQLEDALRNSPLVWSGYDDVLVWTPTHEEVPADKHGNVDDEEDADG